jgi:hypothetical protein
MQSNIKDVARRAGVSIATVSHVLNNTHFVSEEKRRKILTAVDGLNYRPNFSARSLRAQKISHIGILICELYAAKNPRMLTRTLKFLIDTCEGNGYSAVVCFVSPKTILTVSDVRPDCGFSFLVTDSMESYGHVDFTGHKLFFIDMGRTRLASVNPSKWKELQFHYAGYYYFTWLANFISDNLEKNFCFFMIREDVKILQELYINNSNYKHILAKIKVINSEMSEAHVELAGLLANNSYDNIYLTDHKFALGAVRLLLLKPELIHTRTAITFFSYDCGFENFNLFVREEPFFLLKTNVDEIVMHAKEFLA